jgi:hypothetical protein
MLLLASAIGATTAKAAETRVEKRMVALSLGVGRRSGEGVHGAAVME